MNYEVVILSDENNAVNKNKILDIYKDKKVKYLFLKEAAIKVEDIVFEEYIKLMEKYDISAMKEEAVFFLVHTFDLLKRNKVKNFEIHYILPRTIFQNESKSFKSFQTFLKNNLNLVSIQNLKAGEFENVSQDLVLVSFDNKKETGNTLLDGKEFKTEDFYGVNEDYWDYRAMFKKGECSLGSVPAESLFFSIKDETKLQFQERLKKLFFESNSQTEIKNNLMYSGTQKEFHRRFHLNILNSKNSDKVNQKLDILYKYIDEIKTTKVLIDKENDIYEDMLLLSDLENIDNFKNIKNRKNDLFYFRLDKLKKTSFIYILNPKPGKSFYFTSNPTKTSTDYFGYCDYDVNRNSSPGSMRTILVDNLKERFSPEFASAWADSGLKTKDIFEYMIYISESEWYKNMLNDYYRIYFGIPKIIDKKGFELWKKKTSKKIT
jgi:hypothetical protein